MPTALLQTLSKKYGVPLPKIEKMWEKAKLVMETQNAGKPNYALVVHILKNMVASHSKKLSASKVLLSESKTKPNTKVKTKTKAKPKGPAWWEKMSPDRQRAYLKKHPNSAMIGTLKKNLKPLKKSTKPSATRTTKPRVKSDPLKEVVDSRTEEEVEADKKEVARQEKVAEANDSITPANPTEKQRSIFRNLFSAGSKAMKSVNSSVKNFVGGPIERANDMLQKYAESDPNIDKDEGDEDEEYDDEEEAPKKNKSKIMGILGKVALAAVVAGIGVGVVMIAPAVAPTLAELYFNRGRSLSANDELPTTVDDLTKDFVDWLSHQDIVKLMEENQGEVK